MPAGRPTDYKPDMAVQAAKLCKLGATTADLADFFECTTRSIDRWAAKHEEFGLALKAGKAVADERVERSLFHRAVGYSYDAVKIFQYQGAVVEAPYREHIPPDTTAAIFWLKNRKPAEWREKSEHEHKFEVTLAKDDAKLG